MSTPSVQSSFNAGEISPELYGEVDLKKISAAATTMRNCLVNYRGGALSRGGLAFVGRCKQQVSGTGPPRPITFQFSITQAYALEFGDQYLRFVYQGGYVLENPVAITGATQVNPAQIDVTGTPFANGDWVFASGVGGMTQLNGNTYIVAGAASGHFTLEDLNGNPVNSTAYGAYTSGGTFSRIYTVVSPYAAVDLPYLKFTQSADVMTLTCSNPVTGTEYPPYALERLGAVDWSLTAITFAASIAAPTGLSILSQPSQQLSTYYSYVVTAIDAVTGEESVASNPISVQNNDISLFSGTNTISWTAVAGAGSYNVYKATASYGYPVPVGSIYGFMSSVLGTSTVDTNITPDFSQGPPLHANPFARGQILQILPTAAGINYSQTTSSFALTTGTGTGFVGAPVWVNGGLAGFYIQDPGQGFLNTDTIGFSDTGGGVAIGNWSYTTTNETDGDECFFNGVKLEFKAAPFQNGAITSTNALAVEIGNTVALTCQNLQQTLSSYYSPNLTCAAYSAQTTMTGAQVNITYKTPGVVGNAFTMAQNTAHGVPSGGNLTGGGTVGSGAAASLVVGPQSGTYPGCCAYFQERLFFANSFNNPDTFNASKTGAYFNFDTGIPVSPDDAITATPWAEQVNGIQWLIPMPGGLITLTGSRAWQIVGEGSYALSPQPITPATTQAQPQAFNGASATVPPIVVDFDILYRESINNVIRDMAWNFWTNIYTGNDLTQLSSHLFLNSNVVNWCWARAPYKTAWAFRDDGTMLSLAYLKEQEVYGWARHDTQGLVVGITSVSEPPVNAVYAIVQRFPPYAPAGIYVMERMDNRLWQSVEDAYAVDSGVSNPMVTPVASMIANSITGPVTFTASASVFVPGNVNQVLRMGGGIANITGYSSGKVLTGTWVLSPSVSAIGLPFAASGDWTVASNVSTLNAPHLAGMTVNALADGVPVVGLVVSSTGLITLPFAASNVKAGLPFTAQVQTPYLNPPTMAGRRKVISAATVRLAGSGNGFQTGTNQPDGAAQNPPQLAPTWSGLATANTLQPTGGQSPAATYQSPTGKTVTQLWTGDLRVIGGSAEWNSKGQVAVQQTLPLALELLAVVPETLEGDVPEQAYSQQQRGQGGMTQQPRGPGRHMISSAHL